MKFYRDFKSIFKNNIYLVIGCGGVIPLFILYLTKPYFEITDGSGISMLIIVFFCAMWLLALYALYKILTSLRHRDKITLEFNDSGIRYPYLLDESVEIAWENIKNIEYVVDQTSDNTEYYIVIQLNENLDVGKSKRVPNMMNLSTIQKRYDSKILLVFQEILKGYELQNVAEIMNAHRKRVTGRQVQVAEDYPIRYKGVEGTWGEYLFKAILSFGAAFYIVYSILISTLEDMNDNPIVITSIGIIVASVIGAVSLYIIVSGIKGRIVHWRGVKGAIACNYEGIYLVNDVKYNPCIAWADIVDIRVEKKDPRKKSSDKPCLVIELSHSMQSAEQFLYIHNDLVDTSVYEVCNVLNDYRQFNGY